MRITKFGHACVRIEHRDATVVIDPGVFTEAEAVDGATAILVTHEHPDHWDASHLRRTDALVHTIGAVAAQLPPDIAERTLVHSPGGQPEIGVETTLVGEKHAEIYRELPHFDNSGYLFEIDGITLFHPGDALTIPEQAIDVLFLPASAPWLKASECIDYAIAVGARQNIPIHEAVYSEAGLGIVLSHVQRFIEPRGQEVRRLQAGEDLSL
ncbi:MAG TPA: MBL fold metallo-hydrolase [Marmoricola sp.]|nr:MBL fold metallo-hydrolase [Marmoricola sp.]